MKSKNYSENIIKVFKKGGFVLSEPDVLLDSDYIIERSGMSKREMGLLHASIWLSLTGYVKEDIDAILYSFYRGCQLWTEAVSL